MRDNEDFAMQAAGEPSEGSVGDAGLPAYGTTDARRAEARRIRGPR